MLLQLGIDFNKCRTFINVCNFPNVFSHRYGRPDPLLQRDCDIRISLRMASVQYVHTQRFQAEVVSFIQHFTQLQDVLGRQRAAIEGQTVWFWFFILFFSPIVVS